MSAAFYPKSRSNNSVLLAILLLAGLILMILASYHAVMTHGQAAINAQNCFNGSGNVARQTLFEPTTGRRMSFCEMNGHWFVSIDSPDGGNVTMFPRSFARCLRDVLDYALRSGFTSSELP